MAAKPGAVLGLATCDLRLNAAPSELAVVILVVVAAVGADAIGATAWPADLAPDRRHPVDKRDQLGAVMAVPAGERPGERDPGGIDALAVLDHVAGDRVPPSSRRLSAVRATATRSSKAAASWSSRTTCATSSPRPTSRARAARSSRSPATATRRSTRWTFRGRRSGSDHRPGPDGRDDAGHGRARRDAPDPGRSAMDGATDHHADRQGHA